MAYFAEIEQVRYQNPEVQRNALPTLHCLFRERWNLCEELAVAVRAAPQWHRHWGGGLVSIAVASEADLYTVR